MTLRAVKVALVFGVAILHSLIFFNNVTDYGSNYQYVRHVLMMDTTFPGNHGIWRALQSPFLHTAFYLAIIAWEGTTALLCWWGGWKLAKALPRTAGDFQLAKRVSLAALGLGLVLWLVAFQAVGGEWFLMWQSKTWNGLADAFRMFTVVGIVLLIVAGQDVEGQP